MIASFALLKSSDFTALLPDLTLFLFPVGGLEQHGAHLPVGTKLFQAEARTRDLAQILETRLPSFSFILMPLLPLTVDSHTNAFSLNVRGHVVRDAIVDQCSELVRLGFKNFAAVSAHVTPKQLTALEDAARIVNRKKIFGGVGGNLISTEGALIGPKQVFDSPMISLPDEHGGETDTAFLLHENPAQVDANYQTLATVAKPRASVSRFFAYLRHEIDGYWGSPSLANPVRWRENQTRDLNEVAEKMIPWLEKGKGQGLFRSGYGYFPWNGSFFKAYLLATIFFVMMLVWALWSMRDAFDA
jgi:creatinine amidohydrolase/Fe(II)-dependent formamide hydrolase-like protein